MRDIKYDIVVQNDVCINHKKYYLSQIARAGLKKLFDVENWKVLAYRQCTDLQDINNEDIYESDIIDDKYKLLVYLEDGAFYVNPPCGESPNGIIYIRELLSSYLHKRKIAGTPCVILGNKYKNKELLNV